MKTSSQSQIIRQRRSILFWIFLLISVPFGVVVVLYIAGYRFDDQRNAIVRYSALSVETTPATATVRVDGEILTSRTPYVGVVAPGRHTVHIEAPGSLQWEKTFSFDPGKAVLLPDVMLFTATEETDTNSEFTTQQPLEPVLLAEEHYDLYSNNGFRDLAQVYMLDEQNDAVIDASRNITFIVDDFRSFDMEETITRINSAIEHPDWNRDVLAYATGGELWIYNTSTDTYTLLIRQTTPITDLVWHPSGAYVFFSDYYGVHAVELDNRDERQQWRISSLLSEDIRMSRDGSRLEFDSDGQVYFNELFTRTEEE